MLKKSLLEYIYPTCPNKFSVLIYRIANGLYRFRIPELPYLFYLLNFFINGCEIHYRARIGKNFKVNHSRGVVIGKHSIIGDNVKLRSGVVLGNKGKDRGMPEIGNNVEIGAGAKIIGAIKIGDNCVIGANSVVTKSFEANKVIVGVPAKALN